eukprot:scaffold818_cov136-Cylindrotheca_fusiformis.AAC.52
MTMIRFLLLSIHLLSFPQQGLSERIGGISFLRSLAEGNDNQDADIDEATDDVVQWVNEQWRKEKMENATTRVNDDLNGMWTTTPSEWDEEYWELLGAILLVVFAVLLCFCFFCCTPCCDTYEEAPQKPLVVATRAEIDRKQPLKEPILEKDNDKTDSPRSVPLKKGSKRKTLWQETVFVWKDFLQNGLGIDTMDDDDSRYSAPRPTRRSSKKKSAVKKRGRSSSRTSSTSEELENV